MSEIKKKGFSIEIANNDTQYSNSFEATDFSKIKIGAKMLDDAIFTLGDLKKIDCRLASKEAVLKAIHTCDYETMREISNFFYKNRILLHTKFYQYKTKSLYHKMH